MKVITMFQDTVTGRITIEETDISPQSEAERDSILRDMRVVAISEKTANELVAEGALDLRQS